MAFPTTQLLDTFTGADENPITTNWTCPLYTGEGPLKRVSGQVTDTAHVSTFANGWYDVSTFGPDCEAYLTLATWGVESDQLTIFARINNQPSANDAYGVRLLKVAGADNDIWRLGRWDDGGGLTALGADVLLDWADGDGAGISCVGSTISAWHRPGAAGTPWNLVVSYQDSTYPGAGSIGLQIFHPSGDGGLLLDDFGGGTIVGAGRRIFKRFYGPALLTNVAADLYTVPSGRRAIIRHVHASNPTASSVDFTLSIGADAATTRLWDGYPIPTDVPLQHFRDHTLAAGEKIQGFAGTNNVLNLTIDGYEEAL